MNPIALYDAHEKYITDNYAKELATGKVSLFVSGAGGNDLCYVTSHVKGVGTVRSESTVEIGTGKRITVHSVWPTTRPMSGIEKEVQHMAEGEQLYATKKVPEKCNWESDALYKAQLSAEQKLRKELLTLLIENGTGVDNAILCLPRIEKLIRTGTDSQ
jgi:hypothetical protein